MKRQAAIGHYHDDGSEKKKFYPHEVETGRLDPVSLTPEERVIVDSLPDDDPSASDLSLIPLRPEKRELQDFSDNDSDKSPGTTSDSPQYEENDTLQLRSGKKTISPVGWMSGFPAYDWNDSAEYVYYAFKVKRYIVHPNYILSMTTQAVDEYDPTVDCILRENRPNLPSWSDVSDTLAEVLPVFKGCEALPNLLRNYEEADKVVKQLRRNVRKAQRLTSGIAGFSPLENYLNYLDGFSNNIMEKLSKGKFREEEFQNYLHELMNFFIKTVTSPFSWQKKSLKLDLSDREEKCREMTVQPDIVYVVGGIVALVGEAKKFSVSPRELKHLKGHRVHDPTDTKKKSHCNQQPGPSGEDSTLRGHQQQGHGNPQPDSSGENSNDSRANAPQYYRKLYKEEKYKTDCILPQLLAEMLAAIDTNSDEFKENVKLKQIEGMCEENECVKLGLILDAFKLRFVRMILRRANGSTRPKLSEIRSQNIRCDVFLTQELNLFKAAHVNMFFQILFAMSCSFSR